jgi:hypothetical protein
MEAAVDVDDLSGAERQQVLRDGNDGPADVVREGPSGGSA